VIDYLWAAARSSKCKHLHLVPAEYPPDPLWRPMLCHSKGWLQPQPPREGQRRCRECLRKAAMHGILLAKVGRWGEP
jgi:hypothetical protein